MTSQTIPPIRRELVVGAPQERAFRMFTEAHDRWWPREHKIGKSPMLGALLEPRSGGRWYERGEDGSECDWGRVLVWEPPERLVLAWQITAEWQFDLNLVTEVEVTFAATSPTSTAVVFEHRNLDRFGEAAAQIRKMMEPGWIRSLDAFAQVAANS